MDVRRRLGICAASWPRRGWGFFIVASTRLQVSFTNTHPRMEETHQILFKLRIPPFKLMKDVAR